jgi:MFS family permease
MWGRFFKQKMSGLNLMLLILAVAWIAIVAGPGIAGLWTAAFSMFLMGAAAGGFITTAWALIRETTPDSIMGLTSGMLNPAPFFGVAVFQGLTGSVLDHIAGYSGTYTPKAYAVTFSICLAVSVACLVLLFVFRERLSTEIP